MNELFVIRFLFLSDVFLKLFPNPRKTDLVFTLVCCQICDSIRQFYIKINQTKKPQMCGE